MPSSKSTGIPLAQSRYTLKRIVVKRIIEQQSRLLQSFQAPAIARGSGRGLLPRDDTSSSPWKLLRIDTVPRDNTSSDPRRLVKIDGDPRDNTSSIPWRLVEFDNVPRDNTSSDPRRLVKIDGEESESYGRSEKRARMDVEGHCKPDTRAQKVLKCHDVPKTEAQLDEEWPERFVLRAWWEEDGTTDMEKLKRELKEKDVCTICSLTLRVGKTKKLCCEHIFHDECIKHDCCPTCMWDILKYE